MTKRSKRSVSARSDGKKTLAGWRANALELRLGAEDLDLLDNVISVAPMLRIVAAIGQEARRRRLGYPIATVEALVSCLGRDKLVLAGHRVNEESIRSALPPQWFPIAHEGEFLSCVHLALIRCEADARQARPRPVIGGLTTE